MRKDFDLHISNREDSVEDRIQRNSVDRIQNLKIQLWKLRTSLSSAALGNLPGTQEVYPLGGTRPYPNKKNLSRNASPIKIIEKFDHLQDKLKRAKQCLAASSTKQMQSLGWGKEDQTTVSEEKPYNEKTEREEEKPRLVHYTSMKAMPVGINQISANPYLSREHRYYVSEVVSCLSNNQSPAFEHVRQSMQMLLQYKLIRMSQENKLNYPTIKIPERSPGKKTLFIDLDETLIHCFETEVEGADMQININLQGNKYPVSFNIRPYAISFLKKMKKKWEIIVFTASHQSYADAIIDEIDPEGALFDCRLYRQHCRELAPELFIKDLTRIDRDLAKVILVDNSSYSYAMQLDNGVPILPFYEGQDFQLRGLQIYLNFLADCEDVRQHNRQHFKLQQYSSFQDCRDLIRKLYGREDN